MENEMITGILLKALEIGATDLFITAGKKAHFRIAGNIVSEGSAIIPEKEITLFREGILSAEAEENYNRFGSYDASCTIPKAEARFRVNFFRSLSGASMAVRPVHSGSSLFFADLNLPQALEKYCDEMRGLILVTGSTGSGKSTTLAAMINYINRKYQRHILTIEDPIEFVHEDFQSLVSQREINTETSGFAEGLRSAVRENPDVIVIGEMRDKETVQAAVNAALTGHLVITTVHTSDTVQAVERILSLFPEELRGEVSLDLGSCLNLIVSQRLVASADGKTLLPAVEMLPGTPTVCKQIKDRDFKGIEDTLRNSMDTEMISFNRYILKLYQDKKIPLAEARKAATNRNELDLLIRGMESGIDTFRNRYAENQTMDSQNVDMHSLLKSALKLGASDLVLSCGAAPTLRLNGTLCPLDLPVLERLDIQRLLFSVISRNQRVELEEKRELDLALSVLLRNSDGTETNARFRLNAFYQRSALGVVARVVNSAIPSPEDLTLPLPLVNLISKRQGLILITGPTGSGKSTTLASLIDLINRTRSEHIITIEDPIEYVHDNIKSIVEQRELHSDTLSFSNALKYALRQNPDVIMVGEMRDLETIAAALTAAETGHLVLGTIHTNSAPQTIDRIVDTFPTSHQNQIRLQLAGVLLGVISQRLIPRLDGKGRAAAFEVMIGTPPVQALVRDGHTQQLQSVIETSFKDGMITLEKSLEKLYLTGIISEEETKKFKADCKAIQSF